MRSDLINADLFKKKKRFFSSLYAKRHLSQVRNNVLLSAEVLDLASTRYQHDNCFAGQKPHPETII